jgi:hypothetical protein
MRSTPHPTGEAARCYLHIPSQIFASFKIGPHRESLMFEEIKFRWRERKLDRTYGPLLAKEQKGSDAYAELNAQYAEEQMELSEERRLHFQQKLLGQARRLFLPVPPYRRDSENWEEANRLYGHYFLTEKAIKEIRKDIREERKARREMLFGWISPMSGIIGTVVGYLLGKLG